MYNRIRTAIGFSTVIHQSCFKSILVTVYFNYLLKIKKQNLAHLHYIRNNYYLNNYQLFQNRGRCAVRWRTFFKASTDRVVHWTKGIFYKNTMPQIRHQKVQQHKHVLHKYGCIKRSVFSVEWIIFFWFLAICSKIDH